MTQEISIQKNTFTMHPSGGMLWHEKHMLLIADVHLGKVSHFRKHGSAVPLRAVAANFDQLTRVADYYQAQSICFLGDLFHRLKYRMEAFRKMGAVSSRNLNTHRRKSRYHFACKI